MGRYFPYHIHPLSVGEILHPEVRETEFLPPKKISPDEMEHLFTFGGFPEPFLEGDKRFSNNWQRLRKQPRITRTLYCNFIALLHRLGECPKLLYRLALHLLFTVSSQRAHHITVTVQILSQIFLHRPPPLVQTMK